MSTTNKKLVEAVDRWNNLDEEYRQTRIEVAELLEEAARTMNITDLARLTRINRTTIYWLIKTWSPKNANPINENNSGEGA